MFTTRLLLLDREIWLLNYVFRGLHWYELHEDEGGHYLQEKDTGKIVCWECGLFWLLQTRDDAIDTEIPPIKSSWERAFGKLDLTEVPKFLFEKPEEKPIISKDEFHKRLPLTFDDESLLYTLFGDKIAPPPELYIDETKIYHLYLKEDEDGYYLEDDFHEVKSWEECLAFLLLDYKTADGSTLEDADMKEWWDNSIFAKLNIERAQNEMADRIVKKIFE